MVSKEQVKKIVLSFPGAVEGTSYGYPSYKVVGKFSPVCAMRIIRW